MKVNAVELLSALTKVNGIVGDKSVVEELRSFHMLPEGNRLKIGGTDSNMMLVESVEIEPTENSDGSLLVLSAGKVLDILRYAGHEVEIEYSADEEEVKIVTPRSSVTLKKHFGLSEDIIDFDLELEEDFVDTIKVSDLKTVFNSLASIIDSTGTDPSAKTIFLTGEKALVGDDTTLSLMKFATKGKYEFSLKVVKQIMALISSLDGEAEVSLKMVSDGDRTLLKTPVEVFSFGFMDVLEPETEVIDEFEAHASVFVSKEDFIRSIHLVRATSEEDMINVEIGKEVVELTSYYEGENARDEVAVLKGKVNDTIAGGKVKIESLASQLLKLSGVIGEEGIVVSLDTESSILIIRDKDKELVSAISVLIL